MALNMLNANLLVAIFMLSSLAQSTVALSCVQDDQIWVLRVEGPLQLPDICFVQVLLHVNSCKATLQNSMDLKMSKSPNCSWLKLDGKISGKHAALHGPTMKGKKKASKWTLSQISDSDLQLDGPKGYSVMYKVVEKHIVNADHLGDQQIRRKLQHSKTSRKLALGVA